MSTVLLMRFSALGDVCMTLPVVDAFARTYPNEEIYFLSNSAFASLFDHCAPNVHFVGADFKGKHRGLPGLLRLSIELKKLGIDKVGDLHNVIRSIILRFLFTLIATPTRAIRKDKSKKQLLTRKKNKKMVPLTSNFTRYQDVILRLGYRFDLNEDYLFPAHKEHTANFDLDYMNIGIAPFAKHKGKRLPKYKISRIINHFAKQELTRIYMFGGGEKERKMIRKLAKGHKNVFDMTGTNSLSNEISIMKNMHLMLTMDSANMHLAALSGTRVMSVWGATHPFAGFKAWQTRDEDIFQLDMDCRPCSVFGGKKCYRKDYACLQNINPDHIIEKMEEKIHELRSKP